MLDNIRAQVQGNARVVTGPTWSSRPMPAPRHGRDDSSQDASSELIGLNRKQRNRKATSSRRRATESHDVIIGKAYTFETVNNAVAEPVCA